MRFLDNFLSKNDIYNMSYIGPITKDILDQCSKELKKPTTKEKIMKNVIDPIVSEFFSRYYAYLTCFVFIQLIIIILLVYIIYILKQ
jgi:hypothetical protein